MAIALVHGVSTRGERLASLAAVGRGAGLLTVHDVGGNGQNRGRRHGVAVGVVHADVLHELVHNVVSDLVDAVVVVTVLGELALGLEVDDDAVLVTDGVDLGVLDGGQESATTERPAMPVANQRCTCLSCRAIWMRS